MNLNSIFEHDHLTSFSHYFTNKCSMTEFQNINFTPPITRSNHKFLHEKSKYPYTFSEDGHPVYLEILYQGVLPEFKTHKVQFINPVLHK